VEHWPGGSENARAYYKAIKRLCEEICDRAGCGALVPDPANLRKLAGADWAVLVRGELAALLEQELPVPIRPVSRDARALARRMYRDLPDDTKRVDPNSWSSSWRKFGVRPNALSGRHPDEARALEPPPWVAELPPMIERTSREDLEDALREGREQLVLVEGPPAAGKTRLVHHTLGQIAKDRTVILHSPDTQDEVAIVIATIRRDTHRALLESPSNRVLGVVFIEDLELFSSTSQTARDGLDVSLLHSIKESEPVVIVATVGGKNAHLARLADDPHSARAHASIAELTPEAPAHEARFRARTIEQVAYTLADLREHARVVSLSPTLDEHERQAARSAGYSDAFLNGAPEGPGARFTAAEALLDHYERLVDNAQAVVDALIAWRRHVTATAIPLQGECLLILWRSALATRGKHMSQDRMASELDRAIGLATEVAPKTGRRPVFRVSASLDIDDHLARYPPPRAAGGEIDDETFGALLLHLSPDQAREAGLIARTAAPDRAFAAWRSAAGDDPTAAFSLAAYLQELERPADEVIAAYNTAIELGSVDAANSFALYLLRIQRTTDEVIAAFERAIALGSPDAALNLASLIDFMGLPEEEFMTALQRGVEMGSAEAEQIVSVFETERELEQDEYLEFLHAEVNAGSSRRARELAELLPGRGAPIEEIRGSGPRCRWPWCSPSGLSRCFVW
jgi:hypothetical protein